MLEFPSNICALTHISLICTAKHPLQGPCNLHSLSYHGSVTPFLGFDCVIWLFLDNSNTRDREPKTDKRNISINVLVGKPIVYWSYFKEYGVRDYLHEHKNSKAATLRKNSHQNVRWLTNVTSLCLFTQHVGGSTGWWIHELLSSCLYCLDNFR